MDEKKQFYKEMKEEVNDYFIEKKIDSKANSQMIIKFFGYLIGLILSYSILLFYFDDLSNWKKLILCFSLSIFIMTFKVNNLHDIMHGSFSKNYRYKKYVSYLLDLLGASSFIWKNKHNISHHYYTNNAFIDNDVNVSPILRFTPHHKLMNIHRFQKYYTFIVYCFQCYFWFYISDFKNILKRKITTKNLQGFNSFEICTFFILKFVHLIIFLYIPSRFVGWSNALIGYFIVYSLAGLMLALIFQVAHIFENSHFHSEENFDDQNEWAKVQIEGSCVFGVNSFFGHWVFGGLHLQVVHHLFPNICHIHYRAIFPIIEKHCKKNGIKLQKFNNFGQALISHYRQLELLGIGKAFGDIGLKNAQNRTFEGI